MVSKKLLLLSIMVAIFSCQSPQKTTPVSHSLDSAISEYENETKAVQDRQPLESVPDEINQALLPSPSDTPSQLFGESKYDINAQKVGAAAFLVA